MNPNLPKESRYSGVGLRLMATFFITAMSACVHKVASELPLGQIMFWRSAISIVPIVLYVIIRNDFPNGLKTKRPKTHLTRGFFGACAMALSFTSLAYLPVANAEALGYLAPVLTLPLAAIMLGERLTIPIISATLLGFTGVIALLWSSLETFGQSAMIGILAGLGFATLMAVLRVYVKAMTKTEHVGAITFYVSLIAGTIGLATWPFGWVSVSTELWPWLIGAGVLGGLGHIAGTEAVARAPVSVLAPFDFTGLIWALGFDMIIFSFFPDTLGIIGVVAITCAALLVTFKGLSKAKVKDGQPG